MTNAIACRGPDEGHWIEEGVGIGHRRLAIIDLSPLAHQPMLSQDNYVLSYNGEIYTSKIAQSLEAMDYSSAQPAGSADCLGCLGRKSADRLNGMFAFVGGDPLKRL